MADNPSTKVMAFALVAFILIGALFGMQIMAFIFGNISSTDLIDDDTFTVTNESGGYINATGYTLVGSSRSGFTSPTITLAINATDNTTILSGNYSISATGIVTNASVTNYASVLFSYTYTAKSDQEIVIDNVNNESLNAVRNYSEQAGTQFTTIGITITLLVLILLFLVFWNVFMKKGIINQKGKSNAGSFG